jgi:hypothetical protein
MGVQKPLYAFAHGRVVVDHCDHALTLGHHMGEPWDRWQSAFVTVTVRSLAQARPRPLLPLREVWHPNVAAW